MGRKAYIKQAAEFTGLSEWDLRQRAKLGRIPVLKSGNRYVFDLDLVEEFLKNEAMSNVRPAEPDKQYGVLRKVSI